MEQSTARHTVIWRSRQLIASPTNHWKVSIVFRSGSSRTALVGVTVALAAFVLCLAALTGSWIVWVTAVAAALWAAWTAADHVMRQVVDQPSDAERVRATKP